MQSDSDEPLFEESDSGAMAEANKDLEARAEEGAGSGTGSSAGSGGEANSADASQGSPQGVQGSGGQQQEQGDIIPIPDDVGDGQGDDIVLRQIREAAMQETDPVLREKLWEEYRRIKDQ